MNHPNLKICLALPVKTGKINQIKPLMSEVLEEKPDFIEIRFDYIDDISQITSSFLEELLMLTDVPYIFTLRNSHEGGHLNLKETKRLSILRKLIKAKPKYLDIEINNLTETLHKVFNLCTEKNVKPILSYHNFEATETLQNAHQIIESCLRRIKPLIKSNSNIHDSLIFKIIFTAIQFEDNLIPLKLCKRIDKEGYKIISFCMGELGLFSRIMCIKAGSFLTYAALYDKTAPGQISIGTMKEIYSLLDY